MNRREPSTLMRHGTFTACAVLACVATLGDVRAEAPRQTDIDAYETQLRGWQTPVQVHRWIAANFSYDRDRAIALSETQRSRGARFRIHDPASFLQRPAGICVDLSRFAVETLRRIAPTVQPKYLKIKFDPVRIKGNVLRLHWIASFRQQGKFYFFADSHYPGRLSGPYESVAAFIKTYQDARGRRIVSYQLVDSYRKQRRKMRKRAVAQRQPDRPSTGTRLKRQTRRKENAK